MTPWLAGSSDLSAGNSVRRRRPAPPVARGQVRSHTPILPGRAGPAEDGLTAARGPGRTLWSVAHPWPQGSHWA